MPVLSLQGHGFQAARQLSKGCFHRRDRPRELLRFLVLALHFQAITLKAQVKQILLQLQGRGIVRVHAFLTLWASVPL